MIAKLQLQRVARATSNIRAIVRARPNPLPPRVTADDRNAHRAVVQTLGNDAIWIDYFENDAHPSASALDMIMITGACFTHAYTSTNGLSLRHDVIELIVPHADAPVNLEMVAQSTDPIFADPRQVMLELVLAEHEIEAAIKAMRKAWWP